MLQIFHSGFAYRKITVCCVKNHPRICVEIDLPCRFYIRNMSIYAADMQIFAKGEVKLCNESFSPVDNPQHFCPM